MKPKKLLSVLLATLLLLTCIPLGAVSVSAAGSYNPTAAVNYAVAHWNDGKGLCAEFVSDCLKAGGCTAYSTGVAYLRNALINGGWGTEYQLTKNSYYIYQYQNSGKIAAGDPIFYYCKACGVYPHVVICGGFNSNGAALAYSHNSAWNATPYVAGYTDGYGHTGNDIVVYAFHMNTHTHTYSAATCTKPQTCTVCGATTGSALGHVWADATCTTPKTCTRCAATEGSALGHAWKNATCLAPKTCSACNKVEGEALGHDYAAATCTTPKTCKACGVTSGSALGHSYAAATCTTPKTCKTCGATSGSALGHEYTAATCTAPKTCKTCGVTSGSALEHQGLVATCTDPSICEICGIIIAPATGHSYVRDVIKEATCGTVGIVSIDCIECGKNHGVEEIPATGIHTYDSDCDAICDGCGTTRDVPDHIWEAGVCSVCGELSQPPIILIQPQDGYADKGAYAQTVVQAEGEGLTYTWYVSDVGDTKYYKSSQAASTYKLKMTEDNSDRKTYCVISDRYGNMVTTNIVRLRLRAAIITQPKTVYAKAGNYATISVDAAGDDLTYTWYVSDVGDTKYYKSSQATSTYKLKMTEVNSNRKAYCVISDRYGNTVTTNTVRLRMQATITKESATANYAKMGATVKASVTAVGEGLTYTWYYRNEGKTSYSKSSVTKSTYSVAMSAKVKNRRVYCIVKDKYGKTVQSKTFILRESVSITTQPKLSTYAKIGAKASVTVKARGDGLKYQWYYRNAGSTKYSKSSVTSATYSVTMSSKVNGRRLYCVVTDKYGNVVKTQTVILKKK